MALSPAGAPGAAVIGPELFPAANQHPMNRDAPDLYRRMPTCDVIVSLCAGGVAGILTQLSAVAAWPHEPYMCMIVTVSVAGIAAALVATALECVPHGLPDADSWRDLDVI